jgi:hypothetical protein
MVFVRKYVSWKKLQALLQDASLCGSRANTIGGTSSEQSLPKIVK